MVTTEPLSFLTKCKLLITTSCEVLFAEESFYNKFDIVSNTKFNLDLLYGEETEMKSIAEFKKCCEDCCYGSIFITLYKAPVGIGDPCQRKNQQCAGIACHIVVIPFASSMSIVTVRFGHLPHAAVH